MKISTERAEKAFALGRQRAVAREADVAPQYVNRIINAQGGVSLDMAAKIAHAAGISIDELHAWREKKRKDKAEKAKRRAGELKAARDKRKAG